MSDIIKKPDESLIQQQSSNFLNTKPTKLLSEFIINLETYITAGLTRGILAGNSVEKAREEINKLKDLLLMKAQCVELMISNPNRTTDDGETLDISTLTREDLEAYTKDEETNNLFYNIPYIVVYNQGKLIYANDIYIALVGVKDLKILQELAGKNYEEDGVMKNSLVEKMYFGDMKKDVYVLIKNLKRGEGYMYANLTAGKLDSFHRKISWCSYGLDNGTGSVRIGMDVTDELEGLTPEKEAGHMKELYKSKRSDSIPLGFVQDLSNLRLKLKNILGNEFQDGKFVKLYSQLIIIAEMGDVLFNKGPFMMSIWKDGKLQYTNPVYTGVTGYTVAEMHKLISEVGGVINVKGNQVKVNKLTTNLYGKGSELQMVLQRVQGLSASRPHYYEQFSMHPNPNRSVEGSSNDQWVDTFFDTYYLAPGSSLRIGRVQPKGKADEYDLDKLMTGIGTTGK